MSRILIVGGPGNISTSAVQSLLARDHEVAIFTLPDSPDRGITNLVKFYRGDRNNTAELLASVDDFRPDLTADFCCFTPAQANGLVSVLRDRVQKHVFVSTCDVYGYPLRRIPFRESDPFNKTVSQYATDKLECEKIFEAEHRSGSIPLAIARPSYSFGPSFILSLFSRVGGLELISRMKAGRPVVMPGDGQTLIHTSSAHNTGRMIAEILLEPKTAGEGFTVAHETCMTGEDYYHLWGRALGVAPQIVHIPKELLIPYQNTLIPDDLLGELTQFHIAFSMEKFKEFFPYFVWEKTLEDAARECVAFHEAEGDIPPSTEGFEDRLVAAWNNCKGSFNP